ncbi:MAG: type II secretion system protein GspG [Magnetococcales bacterium]|nr:type II secretion system protein GspG [Magnetococcales bacterium]
MPRRSSSAAGFTLIEMAIMLTVFGLTLLGGIQAIRSQAHKATFEKAQEDLRAIQTALLGFLAVNGRLPCPDRDFDGLEESACANANQSGWVPWQTLQVKPLDPWGHLYTYRVRQSYAVSITGAGTGVGNDITVRNLDGTGDISTTVPVIVVSHGRNGLGARTMEGAALPAATLAAEVENANQDATFQFGGDDQLLWIPANVLQYYALKAGWTL